LKGGGQVLPRQERHSKNIENKQKEWLMPTKPFLLNNTE
jgi:hypothetical protein